VFRFPGAEEGRIEIEGMELAMILEGIDLKSAVRQKRFCRVPRYA